jgi:predicted dienelactone hydrolase
MTFASTNHQTMEAGMTEFPDIPGGRIAYGTCGTGPLVRLAHGLGDMRQAYRFLAPLLTGVGYRVAVMWSPGLEFEPLAARQPSIRWGRYWIFFACA